MGRLEPKEFFPKESLYITTSRPAYEKLKIITNVASGPPQPMQYIKARNDRSQDHSTINLSGLESAQGSVLRG